MKIINKFISLFLSILLLLTNIVPISAIYYAPKETKYLYSGFLYTELNTGEYAQCGVNFVDEYYGVTAAHCLDDVNRAFVISGEIDEKTVKEKAIKVSKFGMSPEYNEYDFSNFPGLGDVGYVKLEKPIKIDEYGFIESPTKGCDYFMVGYGLNENGQTLERRSTNVCIQNITDYSFELDFNGNTHFCNGDSGSGIYKKNSNSIVGVTSAYFTEITKETCVGASAYIVARLDSNLSYLASNIPAQTYEQKEPETIDTVPNDYFGDYYPETKNPDGNGYNYDDELLIEIEKLGVMFDEIYPEGGSNNNPIEEEPFLDDTYDEESDFEKNLIIPPSDNNADDPYSTDDIEMIAPRRTARNEETISIIIFTVIVGGLCCLGLLTVGGIILLLKKRKQINNSAAI
ncbi:trypsin-like serine protease [Candidatus Dojkabacteria bacterium]|nr:trypsin-like serine protease [Candidatus Dojkabacteria bacterium]